MIVRLVIVFAVIVAAYVTVAALERRRGRRRVGLGAGVTVVTGPACRLCAPTLAALDAHGVAARVIDVAEVPAHVGPIRALPAVLLVDERGEVVLRRAGRAALSDAATIARAARGG